MVATQEFRQDLTGVPTDGSGGMAGYGDDEMAEGYDDVGASDDGFDPEAPSEGLDDGGEQDPELVALREQILNEHRPQIEAALKQQFDAEFSNLRSSKDREIANARTTERLLRGQIDTIMGFLRSKWTPENNLDPRDLIDLENQLFRTRDQVQTQAAKTVQDWTNAQAELSARFEEVADGIARGDDGQHIIDPRLIREHPEVIAAKQVAMSLAERFYAEGGKPNTATHQRAQAAFRNLTDTQNKVGRSLIAQSLSAQTRKKTNQVRKDQQARGPQVSTSRSTGGTGKMTDDRAWEMSGKKYPNDPGKRHTEYMKILAQHGL